MVLEWSDSWSTTPSDVFDFWQFWLYSCVVFIIYFYLYFDFVTLKWLEVGRMHSCRWWSGVLCCLHLYFPYQSLCTRFNFETLKYVLDSHDDRLDGQTLLDRNANGRVFSIDQTNSFIRPESNHCLAWSIDWLLTNSLMLWWFDWCKFIQLYRWIEMDGTVIFSD